jgi:hypothetical protein
LNLLEIGRKLSRKSKHSWPFGIAYCLAMLFLTEPETQQHHPGKYQKPEAGKVIDGIAIGNGANGERGGKNNQPDEQKKQADDKTEV